MAAIKVPSDVLATHLFTAAERYTELAETGLPQRREANRKIAQQAFELAQAFDRAERCTVDGHVIWVHGE